MSHSNRPYLTHTQLCGHIARIAAILLFFAASACSSSEKSYFTAVGSEGWTYDSPVSFQPQFEPMPSDSLVRSSLAIAVRHSNGYEYSNLWVELSYTNRDTTVVDTFDLRLADQLGRWYGRGLGVAFQLVDTVVPSTEIDLRYPISLRHIMRADTLRGIEQVGIVMDNIYLL